jgi:hypothetical protein
MFVKHAILEFCKDLSPDHKAHGFINFMHIISAGFGISNVVVELTQCHPFKKNFYQSLPGHCIDIIAFFYSNGIIMLITDLILYALPVALTWDIQLRRLQRIGLYCLFALGGLYGNNF